MDIGGKLRRDGRLRRATRGFPRADSFLQWLLGLTALFGLVAAGCTRLLSSSTTLPVRNVIVRDQLVIYSDFGLPPRHRLLDSLAAERGELLHQLGLPSSDEPIHVYLFETDERFQFFMRRYYPRFPTRRAFFVQSDMRLAVYAYWGDRVAEDLRHEVAHGYLHAVVPNIPLWLDEGLAEFAEVPAVAKGRNEPHIHLLLTQLVAQTWRPNLSRLESLSAADAMNQMDYAEAWAWTHWLLSTDESHKTILQGYLHAFRQGGQPLPLSVELRNTFASPDQLLVEHLYSIAPRPANARASEGAAEAIASRPAK